VANKVNFVAGISNVFYDFSGGTGADTCEVTAPSNLAGILCTGDFTSQCDFTFTQADINAISPSVLVSVLSGWISYSADRSKLALTIPIFTRTYYNTIIE
jgi:hypothetical protein